MGKMLDSTLSWIFEKMAKAYVHRTGNSLSDAKVPVVQEVDGKPYFNLSSIGSADLAKLSGANGIDGTIAEAISGLKSSYFYRGILWGNQDLLTIDSGIYYYNINDSAAGGSMEADPNMPDVGKVKDGMLIVNRSSGWTNFLFASYNGNLAIGQRDNSKETISWVYK